jgi:hypothetical protein
MVAVTIAPEYQIDPEESENEFIFDFLEENSARLVESPLLSDRLPSSPRRNLLEEALRRQPDDAMIPVDDVLGRLRAMPVIAR